VTESNVRAVSVRSNDHGNRDLILQADWGRASADWSLLAEHEDTRNRTEEAYQRRNELFDRVSGDPELSRIGSMRELGRKLHAANPEEFGSADAARMAFGRAKRAVGGAFTDGGWTHPE
jgi:hypothetical protein